MNPVNDGHTDSSYTEQAPVVYRSYTTSITASFTDRRRRRLPDISKEEDDWMIKERGGNAKERYDKKRPVISVRVTELQKKRVEEKARVTGKSVGRLVREALRLDHKESKRIFRKGFEKGCSETRKKYKVTVQCACGHYFPVEGEDRIHEVEEILAQHCNCYHRECKPEDVRKSECRVIKRPRS